MDASGQLPVIDGKYQLVRLLGQGGMGAVYEGRHLGTGRRVAVKVIANEALAASDGIIGRFQREARASGAIESEHIAQVLDTGVDPQTRQPYMVMEFLPGEDLQRTVGRVGALVPDVALRVVAQACLGLQKAHEAGVVHRDIKTANIFLASRDGGRVVTKLLDFGIAKMKADPLSSADHGGLTRTGSLIGSPRYMSPEQARGRKTIDHRTDIWSLGIVLYELVSGVTPHGSSDTVGELVFRICSEPARLVQEEAPWVPPEVASIVHRAIALDPEARFPTAVAMLEAVEKLLPAGYSLHESMFVSPSPAVRNVVAPRLALTTRGNSTIAITNPREGWEAAPRKASRVPLVAGIAVAALVVIGGAAIGLKGALHPAGTGDARPVPPTATVTAPPKEEPAPLPPPPAPAPASATTAVRLAISPPDAHVQVDGREAVVDPAGQSVEIKGRLGSSHRVHVTDGHRNADVEVVIADEGAVPQKVELPPLPATETRGAPPARTASPKPTAAPKPSASSPSPGSPPPHDIF